jgi:hypothetical protein
MRNDIIIINMVPSGYWAKEEISSVSKTWNTNIQKQQPKIEEELHLSQIIPANYKPVDITEVIQKQTHLTSDEHEKLQAVLFDFQELFKG